MEIIGSFLSVLGLGTAGMRSSQALFRIVVTIVNTIGCGV
jgi:hypothetical protein